MLDAKQLKTGDIVKLIHIIAVPEEWLPNHTPNQIREKNLHLSKTLQQAGIKIGDIATIVFIRFNLLYVTFEIKRTANDRIDVTKYGVWVTAESFEKP